ncbi:hypothetical protein MRX96_026861 [Rhipicephalus microplus]
MAPARYDHLTGRHRTHCLISLETNPPRPYPYAALSQRNGARPAAEQKAGDSRSGFPPPRFPLLWRILCCLSRWGGSVAESLRQLFVTPVQKRAAAALLSGSSSVLIAPALAQLRPRAVGISIRPRRCHNATRTSSAGHEEEFVRARLGDCETQAVCMSRSPLKRWR